MPSFGFALKFMLLFGLLMGTFEASRGSAAERFVVEGVILTPTVALINATAPAEHVSLVERTISSPYARLRVTRGCEGIEMFLMLAAAIIAFPASARERARGLLLGSLLAYGLSVARLLALFFILRFSPRAWEALHGLVLPLAPIFLIGLYFLRWTRVALPGTARDEARAV